MHRGAWLRQARCKCKCATIADESREAVLAAVKVKGQARLVHLVKTISGLKTRSNTSH